MVASTAWSWLASSQAATAVTTAATAYGLSSAIEADKQATEAREEEKKEIARAKAQAFKERKSLIDKQRLQLMGAGEGVKASPAGTASSINEETLG